MIGPSLNTNQEYLDNQMFESAVAAIFSSIVTFSLLAWFFVSKSYLGQRAKNLATQQDIQKITDAVEKIRADYASRLQESEHKNALMLERYRSVAEAQRTLLERRLEALQGAYTRLQRLSWDMTSNDASAISQMVMEAQEFWLDNCIFMGWDVGISFKRGYMTAGAHRALLEARADVDVIVQSGECVRNAIKDIVKAAELPADKVILDSELERVSPRLE